ncbi:MAG TPA: two-component regulator propeller domain-containing protein, partial [Pyrinomonadaceae bacterium]|nr:two-component regulator propeller domain-containing protein [Pyrinomonadaceae bacterium]
MFPLQPNSRRYSFALAFVAFCCLLSAAAARAEQLPVRTYTVADGLVHDQISQIVQDSRGFLWFCTTDGLSRFDGYRFTNYGVKDGLPLASVNDLLESRRTGVYWVATDGGGISRFDPSGVSRVSASVPNGVGAEAGRTRPLFQTYRLGDDEQANIVRRLYEDHEG